MNDYISKLGQSIEQRSREIFAEHKQHIYDKTDIAFAILLALEWAASVFCALFVSPKTWIGTTSLVHLHVYAAVFLGGLIFIVPAILIYFQRGTAMSRYSIAIAQMLFSALLIHLTGGRIETHFHIFGSLAFLAFYRDKPTLYIATVVTALDHFVRGVYYPQSVFGTVLASDWRWVEHAGWVIFELVFLHYSITKQQEEMQFVAKRQAETEQLNKVMEQGVVALSEELKEQIANISTAVSAMVSSTKDILGNTHDTTLATLKDAERTKGLVDKISFWSKDVSKVIDVVSNIANQTNILALNAAIEANKAGAAGSGFAIVAKEVKELATRTSDSAAVIEEKIVSMRDELKSTSEVIVKTSESINNISGLIDDSVNMQNGSNVQITTAIGQVNTKLNDLLQNIRTMKASMLITK